MTNAVLNVLVLAGVVGVSWPTLRRLRPGPLWATVALLVVLTAVFDSLMIIAGLVEYAPDKILHVYIGRAPVEDFAYAIAAAVGMPALWTVLEARSRRTGHGQGDGEAGHGGAGHDEAGHDEAEDG